MTYGMLKDLQILEDIAKQDGSNYGVSKAPDVTVSTITAMPESHVSTQYIDATAGSCVCDRQISDY